MARIWIRAAEALSVIIIASTSMAHPGPHAHEDGQTAGDADFVATMFHNEVSITEDGTYRYITSNGIPDHEPGQFPNRGNPNAIRPQRYKYRVSLKPTRASQTSELHHNLFGVALNGVPFDPGTAEFWQRDPRSGWNFEALSGKINLGLDQSLAHVQPTGAYHYHGIPLGLLNLQSKKQRVPQMTLLGYAADGFPIYGPLAYTIADDASSPLRKMTPSYQLKQGTRPSGPGGRYDGTFTADWEFVAGSGDLDECNGRTGVTPENPEGTYYYVLTDAFPFIPREWRGTPDPSFMKGGPRGPGPGPGGRGGPGGPGMPGRPFGPPGGAPNF